MRNRIAELIKVVTSPWRDTYPIAPYDDPNKDNPWPSPCSCPTCHEADKAKFTKVNEDEDETYYDY